MTATLEGEGPSPENSPSHEKGPSGPRRRWAAYRRANLLLSGAGVTLALAGVSPRAPVMEAIRRALRAVNQASGLDLERKEASHGTKAGGPRFGKPPAA
jgi:hypothetical protein